VCAWGETLFELYREAELLVIPSLTESGPRVLLEGMLAGAARPKHTGWHCTGIY